MRRQVQKREAADRMASFRRASHKAALFIVKTSLAVKLCSCYFDAPIYGILRLLTTALDFSYHEQERICAAREDMSKRQRPWSAKEFGAREGLMHANIGPALKAVCPSMMDEQQ